MIRRFPELNRLLCLLRADALMNLGCLQPVDAQCQIAQVCVSQDLRCMQTRMSVRTEIDPVLNRFAAEIIDMALGYRRHLNLPEIIELPGAGFGGNPIGYALEKGSKEEFHSVSPDADPMVCNSSNIVPVPGRINGVVVSP